MINHDVGAPGNKNDIVDSLNEFDKHYLKKWKFSIVYPEENHTENHMNYHTATPNSAHKSCIGGSKATSIICTRNVIISYIKLLKKSQRWSIKINIIIFKINTYVV